MVHTSYANKAELVEDLYHYAISARVNLWLKQNEPLRVRAVCINEPEAVTKTQDRCPFVLFASNDGENHGLVVKTLQLEHNCCRVFDSRRASAKWLARQFRKKVQDRPQYKCKDMKADVAELFKLNVSIYKCKRAKRLIMQEMEGSYVDEFNKL